MLLLQVVPVVVLVLVLLLPLPRRPRVAPRVATVPRSPRSQIPGCASSAQAPHTFFQKSNAAEVENDAVEDSVVEDHCQQIEDQRLGCVSFSSFTTHAHQPRT